MKTSPRGIAAIAQHEGIVPAPYLDSVRVWTFGIGHTAAAGGPDPSDMPRGMPGDIDMAIEKAIRVFKTDLATYEARVKKHVTAPLKQHQFDALVSFDFNTGGVWYRSKKTGRMTHAKIVQHLNAGDFEAAGKAFMGWLKPPEIRMRRESEQRLFVTGKYSTKPITVWNVNDQGRIRGAAYQIGHAEFLRMMGEKTGPVAQWGGWRGIWMQWARMWRPG